MSDTRMATANSFADEVPCYEGMVTFGLNDVPYFQDMGFCRGLPHGVEFEMSRIGSDVRLKAPNHGGEPYGDGAIYVRLKDFPDHGRSGVSIVVKRSIRGEPNEQSRTM